jgi:hypothetical protein
VPDDKIPVVGLQPGEGIMLTQRHGLHPVQLQALRYAGASEADIGNWHRSFNQRNIFLDNQYPDAPAATSYVVYDIDQHDREEGSVTSRPSMQYHLQYSSPAFSISPSTTMHEIGHMTQLLTNPLQYPGQKLTHELVAYDVQAALAATRPYASTPEVAGAVQVDWFRRQHLGADNHLATPEFRRLMAESGLFKLLLAHV